MTQGVLEDYQSPFLESEETQIDGNDLVFNDVVAKTLEDDLAARVEMTDYSHRLPIVSGILQRSLNPFVSTLRNPFRRLDLIQKRGSTVSAFIPVAAEDRFQQTQIMKELGNLFQKFMYIYWKY